MPNALAPASPSAPAPLLLRTLRREAVERTPVWIMRQAGRYLPEYRALRAKTKDFLSFCKTPELACEATLQPLARFALDAAIIFSDILVLPDAMGLGLHFVENEGPQFERPVRDERTVATLPTVDPTHDLAYVMEAIRVTKAALPSHIPLIGFAGSPWTVATYAVEGKSSKNFSLIKKMAYQAPETLHCLLAHLAENTTRYLEAQIAAGADVLMLFDSWGGVLTEPQFHAFSLDYMARIVASLKARHPQTPIILFSKNSGRCLPALADTGADALGLDWCADLGQARKAVGNQVVLQGNLDPAALYATPERIATLVEETLAAFGPGSGHIFNLGHGITPDVRPEHLQALVEAVHTLSPSFHNPRHHHHASATIKEC